MIIHYILKNLLVLVLFHLLLNKYIFILSENIGIHFGLLFIALKYNKIYSHIFNIFEF